MKKRLIVMVIAFSFGTINAFATTTDAERQATKGSVTRENAVAVQKGVEKLAQMVDAKKSKANKKAKAAETQVSTADAVNNAVDKISQAVGVLSTVISTGAPELWRIMVRQQYVKAIGATPPYLGLVLIFWIASRAFKKWHQKKIDAKHDDDDEYHVACMFYYGSLVLAAFFSFITIVELNAAIQILINPEYYAIKNLLHMILNKGM